MFSGCMLLSGVLAVTMWQLGIGQVQLPPALGSWYGFVAIAALQLVICNLCLQYGAPRMSANTLALLMSLEVLFAAVSSAMLGAGTLDARVLLGGTLVIGALLGNELLGMAATAPNHNHRRP